MNNSVFPEPPSRWRGLAESLVEGFGGCRQQVARLLDDLRQPSHNEKAGDRDRDNHERSKGVERESRVSSLSRMRRFRFRMATPPKTDLGRATLPLGAGAEPDAASPRDAG